MLSTRNAVRPLAFGTLAWSIDARASRFLHEADARLVNIRYPDEEHWVLRVNFTYYAGRCPKTVLIALRNPSDDVLYAERMELSLCSTYLGVQELGFNPDDVSSIKVSK